MLGKLGHADVLVTVRREDGKEGKKITSSFRKNGARKKIDLKSKKKLEEEKIN